MSVLPKHLEILRAHVGTVLNALNELERLLLREQWGATQNSDKRDRAERQIEARMVAACEHIGIQPARLWALQDALQEKDRENQRLTETIIRMMHKEAA